MLQGRHTFKGRPNERCAIDARAPSQPFGLFWSPFFASLVMASVNYFNF